MPPDSVETIWKPQYRADGTRGPQFALLTCPCDEIFFGGARGGGKSSGMLGHWMAHAQKYGSRARGVFFRRRFKQLEEVQRQANELFPKLGAVYGKAEAVWRFPNGATLKLRHLWDAQAAESYQGHSYCVGAGTPILMADGSYLPIEQIRVGDLVMTLEGPKTVQATMPPKLSPCVRAKVFDASGEFVGEQIHPEDHPFLTSVSERTEAHLLSDQGDEQFPKCQLEPSSQLPPFGSHQATAYPAISHPPKSVLPSSTERSLDIPSHGSYRTCEPRLECPSPWQSYTLLRDGGQGSQAFAVSSVDAQTAHIASGKTPAEQLPPPPLSCPVVLHVPDRRSGPASRRASIQSHYPSKSAGPSSGIARWISQWLLGLLRQFGLSQPYPHHISLPSADDGVSCGQHCTQIVQGSQCRYSTCLHPYDEQPLQAAEFCRDDVPSQDDAEQLAPSSTDGGETDCILECSQKDQLQYIHPYTKEQRLLTSRVELGKVDLEPCGMSLVYDLTVEDANHYITISGLVNKNTWICMEEITQWANLDAMNRMRGTLRSSDGVKCVMLATGNPGGPGHNAVKGRYVDPAPSGYVPIRDADTGQTRVFIPSKLDDNLALVKNDPGYRSRLMALGNPQLVKAWLYGDWAVTFGGLIDDLWVPEKHVIKPIQHFPAGFTYRRAFDWGSSKPSALLMFAVSDGSPVHEMGGFVFPRGSLILFQEWYTVAKDASGAVKSNEGLRLTNQAIGHGIAERCKDREWEGCVADPAIFSEMGRESIYAEIKKAAAERRHRLVFAKANNDRVGGWQRMRDMIENAAADRPEKPGLWVFNTCVNFLRTVPTLQRDDNKPDDVDTDQEDHCLHGDTLVETRHGPVAIKDLVGTKGEVLSIDGKWEPYWHCRLTRKQVPVVSVQTKDGRTIVCTEDHRILTNNGWVKAKNLLGNSIVDVADCAIISHGISDGGTNGSSRNQRHYSRVLGSTVLSLRLLLSEARKAFASHGMGNAKWIDPQGLSRSSCGWGQVKQPAAEFAIDAWDGSPVRTHGRPCAERDGAISSAEGAGWSGSVASFRGRQEVACETRSGERSRFNPDEGDEDVRGLWRRVRCAFAPINDITLLFQRLQIRLSPGIWRGQRDAQLCGLRRGVPSQQVRQDQDVQPEMRMGGAQGSEVVAIRSAGVADVYNLEVDETHCFAVAGGLIVHNCGDAARYACNSTPKVMTEGRMRLG